jgi:hypothetical protein
MTESAAPLYPYHELCREVLSPGAVGVMRILEERILEIYQLSDLLERRLPAPDRQAHEEALTNRLRRVIRFLPDGVSPTPNEVFTAIEFLIYEIDGRPIRVGEAILRLELLADEIRAEPILHDLATGVAN